MKKTKRNNKIGVKYTKSKKIKKNNSKKIKKNNSRKIKKNNSKKIKRGGEFLSAGSFGAVYANPRLLCEYTKTQKGETLETPGIYDEVSKLFEKDQDAIDEDYNVQKLYTELGKDLDEFEKYAIIPKKMCILNKDSLKKTPYNTEEWMKDKEDSYNKDIFMFLHEIHDYHNYTSRKIFKTPRDYNDKYNFIITSDKGGDNLNKLFASVDSDFIFKYFLKEIISIVKGIKIMHSKGFIHSDLKSSNCIAHQYTFKIIDLAGNENIETIKKVGKYSDFGYLYWPHTVVYTDFFKNPDVKLEDIVMTNGLLSEKFNKYDDRNISNYTKFPNYLESSFDIDREYGFTEEEIKKVNKIKEDLYFQKTFNITYPYVYSDKENIKKRIIQTLRNPNSNPNYHHSNFLKDFNTIFQNFENIESLKMDIFKRIDIYGIGTIIMECIYSYLRYTKKKDIDKDIREIIIKLYEIIYDCCYQGKRVANIDEIIEKYEKIVYYYFNIDLFEKTLSEKGVLNEFKQYAIIPSKNDNQTVEKIIDNYKNEKKTLDLILKKINSYDDFKNYLKKITSIAKGIQIIHNSGFIDLIDINMKNCIEDNDTFKIVVSDKVIPYNYTNNSMFTTKLSSYFVYNSKILKNYFNLENKGFSPEEVSEINEMALDIIESFSIIDKKIEQSFYNTNRIGIYCFGIIILDCIYNYLNKQGTQSVPTANSNDIDENIRNAIKQLYLIVYKCCYQSKEIADIGEIISEYETICNKLMDNTYDFSELKLPLPPLPPSSSPSMPRFIKKM